MEKPGTRSAAVQSAMEMHSARPTGSHEHDRSGWLDRTWSCQACSIMAFHKKRNGSPPYSLSPPLSGGMWVVSYWTWRSYQLCLGMPAVADAPAPPESGKLPTFHGTVHLCLTWDDGARWARAWSWIWKTDSLEITNACSVSQNCTSLKMFFFF